MIYHLAATIQDLVAIGVAFGMLCFEIGYLMGRRKGRLLGRGTIGLPRPEMFKDGDKFEIPLQNGTTYKREFKE